MLFQWYLFVFLMVLYVFAKATNQQYKVYAAGEYEVRYRWFTALTIVAVLTYVAATRHPRFIDTWSYYSHYMRESGTWESVVNIFNGDGKDKLFYICTAILKSFLGDRVEVYFGIAAAVPLLCLMAVYRKYSCNFLISVFLFLASGEYVQWSHNGIRQFIAVGITFAATDLLLKRKLFLYYLVVGFASLFHGTALIMVPVSLVVLGKPWNGKMILFMLAVFAAGSSMDTLMGGITTLMESTQYANDVDALLATEGTNTIRVLVYSIPPIMAFLFRRQIKAMNIPIINLAVNMSVAAMGAYVVSSFSSGIFIGRVPIYFSLFNYILLPWMIDRFFEKSSAKVIYLALITCYMGFYYYQMHVVWGAVTAL